MVGLCGGGKATHVSRTLTLAWMMPTLTIMEVGAGSESSHFYFFFFLSVSFDCAICRVQNPKLCMSSRNVIEAFIFSTEVEYRIQGLCCVQDLGFMDVCWFSSFNPPS